jgi:hypothetical protein
MIEITFNGKEHSLPENWEEVPSDKMRKVLELVFATPESGESYHKLLRLLLGYSERNWQKFMHQFFNTKVAEDKREKNAETLQELLHLMSWMWRENMTKKPFECIYADGREYYLFEESFKTMSFGEMTDAYIHAQAFIQQIEEGESRLNKLVATVCRPKRFVGRKSNWNGDIREPYNSFIAEGNADSFADVPMEQRVLILVYFLGTLKDFLGYYDIFDDDDGSPASPEEYPGQSYIKNQHLLAEKGIFGNMDATKAANIHEVFLFLEENKKDIQERIKRQKLADDSNG